jgi:SAM-dependent methyltransferase
MGTVHDDGQLRGGFYAADLAAAHHDRFGWIAHDAAAYLLTWLARHGLPRGRVMDMGCGSGLLLAEVAAAGYEVSGVDVSADMVALARRSVPGADLRVGSVHDAPLPAGCVAVTATGEVVNYAADSRAGIDALRRLASRVYAALVNGGVFLFDALGSASPGAVVQRFHRTDRWCLGTEITESADGTGLIRQITVFTADDRGCWRRSDETHQLCLLKREHVHAALTDAGFDVEITDSYHTAEGRPGWYVVQAHKPTP